MIIDYTIVSLTNKSEFILHCKNLLKQGWQPYGTMCLSSMLYTQAFVMYGNYYYNVGKDECKKLSEELKNAINEGGSALNNDGC